MFVCQLSFISPARPYCLSPFFFFNDTATTEIYTLSLHDALPISPVGRIPLLTRRDEGRDEPTGLQEIPLQPGGDRATLLRRGRSEEHTSELQSPCNLVCRLLLEKKKTNDTATTPITKCIRLPVRT